VLVLVLVLVLLMAKVNAAMILLGVQTGAAFHWQAVREATRAAALHALVKLTVCCELCWTH
jgi:hypothetical protein